MRTPCSCGCTEPHEIARRRTFDGVSVLFWSDGGITWKLGGRIRGVGVSRAVYARQRDVSAGWIVAGLVELYDAAEVPVLVAAARREARKAGHYDDSAIVRNVRHAMEKRRAP